MTLDDLLKEPTFGTEVSSSTNEDYKRVCVEESNPKIGDILKDYAEAIKDASKFYIR